MRNDKMSYKERKLKSKKRIIVVSTLVFADEQLNYQYELIFRGSYNMLNIQKFTQSKAEEEFKKPIKTVFIDNIIRIK